MTNQYECEWLVVECSVVECRLTSSSVNGLRLSADSPV